LAIDTKQLFTQAEVLRGSSQILSKFVSTGMPQCVIPMVVCSAFSLELFLKCLILIERGKPAGLHHLEKLFNHVDAKSRDGIRARYDQLRAGIDARFAKFQGPPPPKTDFDSVLQMSSEAFQNFRYAHEGMKVQKGWMADPIRDCVRERIIELRPDCADV
jgi:hypothetical protein